MDGGAGDALRKFREVIAAVEAAEDDCGHSLAERIECRDGRFRRRRDRIVDPLDSMVYAETLEAVWKRLERSDCLDCDGA